MSCQVSDIQYGLATLSGVPIKSKLTSVPMMADDGVSIKYYKVTILVELIYSVPPAFLDANGINSADFYIQNLRAQLERRGQTLSYNYRGFGITVGTTSHDLVYGPYPEVIDWEPLGANRAVRLVWKVSFAHLRCTPVEAPSTDSAGRFTILQIVEDTNLSIDEDGAITLNTNGTVEVGASVAAATPDASGNTFLNRETLKEFVKWYFPNNLTSFHRTIDVNLRKDHRTVDYRITDTEIKSDNPLYPYTIKIDANHSVQSNLLGDVFSGTGFRSWLNDLDATISVRPGEWKGWAWIVFCHILAQRMGRISSSTPSTLRKALDELNEPDSGDESEPVGDGREDRKEIKRRQIPLFLRISESLYSREVSFTSKWVVITSLFDLFNSTGMFYPIHTTFNGKNLWEAPDPRVDGPTSPDTQWSLWKTNATQVQSIDGFRNIGLPQFSLIFDPCGVDRLAFSNSHQSSYYTEPEIGSTGFETYEASDDRLPLGRADYVSDSNYSSTSRYMEGLTKENSWLEYKNKIILDEETNAEYVPSVEDYPIIELVSSVTELINTTRDKGGQRINGKTETGYSHLYGSNEIIGIRGKPVYKIKMVGYALRVGFQIPAPTLIGVEIDPSNYYQAYRVGKQRWSHELLNTSDEVPVFLAMWEQEYALPFDPTLSNIKFRTSGKPAEFA